MPKGRRVVIQEKAQSDRLPDWASEGAILTECLEERGILEQIGKRLRVQREGGYVGLDVLLFFLSYFASSLRIGIKEFGERTKPHRRQLAALGGRIHFPTPPSISRFLGAVEREDNREFGRWLLLDAAGAHEVLQHPSTMQRDTKGDGWHFFDWDPTSTVLRQRALPVIEGLPEGKRRAEEMKSGYPGRKRGEVQLSRATLQHAGSGLWLGIWMAPGNGEPRRAFEEAVQTVRATCQQANLATENAVIRSDGQGGNIPCITACQAAGVHYVTRWGKYALLEQTEVREQLNKSVWYEVPDSGSGPRRQAAELGWMTLHADKKTRRSDGTPYEPVKSRFVVSRFRTEKRRGSGVFIDGWQYELFATDLEAEAWPAAELVTVYYGRCGQENRFGQEDRELGLDRIFSYHVPGQELANLIGLFVWNLRICSGMNLVRPPCELLPQEQRVSMAVEDPDKLDIVVASASVVRSTSLTTEPAAAEPNAVEGSPQIRTPAEGSAEPAVSQKLIAIAVTNATAPIQPVSPKAPMKVPDAFAPPAANEEDPTNEPAAAADAANETALVAPAVVRIVGASEKPARSLEPTSEQPIDTLDVETIVSVSDPTADSGGAHKESAVESNAELAHREQSGEPVTDSTPSHSAAMENPVRNGNDTDNPSPACSEAKQQLSASLNRLDWSTLLRGKPNWTWDPDRGLVCPDGVVIPLTSVKRFPLDNKRHLRFKAPYATCPRCEPRSECTSSDSPTFRKEASIPLPAHEAASIGVLLVQSRPPSASRKSWQDKDVQARPARLAPKKPRSTGQPNRGARKQKAQHEGNQSQRAQDAQPPNNSRYRTAIRQTLQTWQRPVDDNAGTFAVTSPILLPAELRNVFREKCRGVETYVSVDALSLSTPVRVFALSPGERQRRRLSWTQRHEWNRLPDDAKISIRFADGFGIRPLLRIDSTNSLAA